jgi:hypothetical protein
VEPTKLLFFTKIILIVIFILTISATYKKAQKKGLRSYHFVVLFLLSPLAVFFDYSLQHQALSLDMAALKSAVIYGLPLALILSLFLYITSGKKQ